MPESPDGGQDGPLAQRAGHDINYIGLSGALHAIGPPDCPQPPLALVGDFGGGGMFAAFSICSALLHAQRTGEGQVVDCAMNEGAALLMTAFYETRAMGAWQDERAANLLDGGAPFYRAYRTADRKFIAVGALEPRFYARFLDTLGLTDDDMFERQYDRTQWPLLTDRLAALFATRTRDAWCALLVGDECVTPVLSMGEAPDHAQAQARRAFTDVDGVTQPSPAPGFSRTPLDEPRPPTATAVSDLLASRSAYHGAR